MLKFLMGTVAAVLLSIGAVNAQTDNGAPQTTIEKRIPVRKTQARVTVLRNSNAMIRNDVVDQTTGSRSASDSGYYGSPTDGSSLYEQPPEGKYGIRPSH